MTHQHDPISLQLLEREHHRALAAIERAEVAERWFQLVLLIGALFVVASIAAEVTL